MAGGEGVFLFAVSLPLLYQSPFSRQIPRPALDAQPGHKHSFPFPLWGLSGVTVMSTQFVSRQMDR